MEKMKKCGDGEIDIKEAMKGKDECKAEGKKKKDESEAEERRRRRSPGGGKKGKGKGMRGWGKNMV